MRKRIVHVLDILRKYPNPSKRESKGLLQFLKQNYDFDIKSWKDYNMDNSSGERTILMLFAYLLLIENKIVRKPEIEIRVSPEGEFHGRMMLKYGNTIVTDSDRTEESYLKSV